MTDPRDEQTAARYQADQAYSQAIPLPNPPRGPASPGPVIPPSAPAPTPPPSSGRNIVVALVAIASVVALTAAIVVAALLSGSDNTRAEKGSSSTSAEAAPLFNTNDCLYDVPEAPKVGNCDDGGSPYKVTQVMPAGQQCQPQQTSFVKGRWYCLTPNLNVNYCYSTPVQGTWITAAPKCGEPGTITVVSVVPGLKDPSRCTGESNVNYTFDSPVYTICARMFT